MNLVRMTFGMSAAVWFVMLILACVFWGWPATIVAIVFGILPDIALVGAFAERGRLKPERVRFYNSLHIVPVPVAILIVGIVVFLVTGGFEGGFWGVALAGLAWFVHVAADRAFGFGLRAPDGTIVPVGYQLQ